jgi:tape measure domain-containing protein
MALVGSLVASLSARTEDFERSMQRSQQSLKGFSESVQTTKQTTATLGTGLAQQASVIEGAMTRARASLLAFAATAVSLAAIKTALEASVQAALKVESLTSAFKAVTGSAETARAEFAFVQETAERLGLNVASIAEQYKGLIAAGTAAGLSLQDTRQILLGLVEAGRAYQLSQEDMAGAIRPVVQILAQQKVQGDELRTELSTRIPVMKLLVEATAGAAKNQQEFNDMMQKGQLEGKAAATFIYNLTQLLRRDFGPAAMEAAQGAGASFARLTQSIERLQIALGQQLTPALTESARALTELLAIGDNASAFGSTFTFVIREATSIVVGLTGAVTVLGKSLALLGTMATWDPEAFRIGFADIQKTISDTIDLQQRLISGRMAQQPTAPSAAPSAQLRPLTLATADETEKKARGLSEIEKAARDLERERAQLAKEIADNLARVSMTERDLLETRLRAAGFESARVEELLRDFDLTKAITKELETQDRLQRDREQLTQQLQDDLDAAQLTERQRLELRIEELQFDEKKRVALLAQFDLAQRLRREQEEAAEAAERHASTVQAIIARMAPQRRFQTREEELLDLEKSLVTSGASEFELAQGNVQRTSTLIIEEADRIRESMQRAGAAITDFLGQAFEDFVFRGEANFARLATAFTQMVFRIALQASELDKSLTKLFAQGIQLGLQLLGGAAAVSSAATTVDVSGTLAGAQGFGLETPPPLLMRQHGGTFFRGQPFVAGEMGKELILPTVPGVVLSASQTREVLSGPATVNHITVVIQTPNVQSFQASRGQVSRAILSAISNAQRNM